METPLRILIVEDDLFMATDMEENLVGSGYLVCGTATSYDSAIKLMKQTQPDLVLVDITLDGPADGITTVKELMRIKWVPVIYITGSSETDTFHRAKGTFPAAFLHKPVRVRELAAQIDLAMHNFYAGNISGAPELPEHTFLPTGSGYIRVVKSEILFVKADRGNSELLLTQAGFHRIYPTKPYHAISISLNLGRLLPYLSTGFYQLSRSLVINLNYLDRIESNILYVGSHEISIPDGARKPLIDHLQVVRTR
ncbi:response regulator [Spirosoma sp. SC4-14]|uniref:response regulator n=1 Tax=Spirosoma sp. SC4-14 TaxID=3128900 RepID=UPI0030D3B471